MTELEKYKKFLKDNEDKIAELTKVNKHVKEHIKFLQSLEDGKPIKHSNPAAEEVLRNAWDAPESEQ